MAIALGGLLDAAANLTTAFSKPRTLKQFLNNVDKFGIQVANNFEVNFSGLQDVTFFVTDITIPGMHQNFTTLFYDGQEVYIPVNHEYDHDFSMTVINDANGYIYSLINNFFMTNTSTQMANAGFTMTIKALTGDDNYKGTLYTLNGVRFSNVGSLSYGYGQNGVSTFSLNMKCVECIVTPGALAKAAGIAGTVTGLMGI